MVRQVLESMDNGKPVRESRDADVNVVARWLYYYAGWAQLMDTEMKEWKSCGVVGGIVAWNFPLMLLVWKVSTHIEESKVASLVVVCVCACSSV